MAESSTQVARRGARVPPGPAGYPVLENTVDLYRDPLGLLERCARDYGDVVRIPARSSTIWLLGHPDDIERAHVRSTRGFDKGYGTKDPLLGNGLVNSEGDFWRKQRRLVQPSFHRKRINGYGETMISLTHKMLADWTAGKKLDLHEEMIHLTLNIAVETLFGSELGGEQSAAWQALRHGSENEGSMFEEILGLPDWVPTTRRRKEESAVSELDRIILGIIARKREEVERGEDEGDLLSMLISARDEDGSQMDDRQLRDEAMTIFLAGHETTANSLTFAWMLLHHNPRVRQKLEEEIAAVLGDRSPTPADARALPYTEAVIKEAMRLYPPVWIVARSPVEDTEVGGYHVPAGTQLAMSQWVVHRDGRFYEDPLVFKPERWLEGDVPLEKRIPRYAYFPFGGGPRQCIGNAFAMMEAVLIVATVAGACRLEVDPEFHLELEADVTIQVKNGLPATVGPRRADET